MHQDLLRDAGFWSFLLSVDKNLAKIAREKGCDCGGRLHCANYPRKPRGAGKDLPEKYGCRLSWCCDRDGCRKRVTPPSVRFLGRKVYLAAVVVLVAAMRHGATPRRVRELSTLFGADRRTIAGWQVFWREQFPQTRFWKVSRACFASALDVATLPRPLMGAFFIGNDPREEWRRLLEFLSPITITGGMVIEVSR